MNEVRSQVTAVSVVHEYRSHWMCDDTYYRMWFVGHQPTKDQISEVCDWEDDGDYDDGINSCEVADIQFFDEMNAQNGDLIIDMVNKTIAIWKDDKMVTENIQWAHEYFGGFFK